MSKLLNKKEFALFAVGHVRLGSGQWNRKASTNAIEYAIDLIFFICFLVCSEVGRSVECT